MVVGVLFFVVAMAVARCPTPERSAPTRRPRQLAGDYLLWFIPAMALQFAHGGDGLGAARHRQLQARA